MEKIYIGISPDYPPFESKNIDGEIIGFDFEMSKWIAEKLKSDGYIVEWKEMDFDTITSSVQEDKIDLGISGFTYDEQRAKQVSYSDAYYGSALVCVVPKGSDITKLSDLTGKTIVVQTGSTCEKVANEMKATDDTITIESVEDINAFMQSSKAKKMDACFLNEADAKEYKDFKILKEEVKTLEENTYYAIGNKDNKELMEALNKVIEEFKKSEDYKTFTEKWGL